jgi:hypothetical protein
MADWIAKLPLTAWGTSFPVPKTTAVGIGALRVRELAKKKPKKVCLPPEEAEICRMLGVPFASYAKYKLSVGIG